VVKIALDPGSGSATLDDLFERLMASFKNFAFFSADIFSGSGFETLAGILTQKCQLHVDSTASVDPRKQCCGFRREKMTHKNRNKLRKFIFISAGCSLLSCVPDP
jgi:hypothetical protein